MFATVIPPVERFGRRDAYAFGLHFSDVGVLLRSIDALPLELCEGFHFLFVLGHWASQQRTADGRC
jgi:hypothetical protein